MLMASWIIRLRSVKRLPSLRVNAAHSPRFHQSLNRGDGSIQCVNIGVLALPAGSG
jgi:hypothetical protein